MRQPGFRERGPPKGRSERETAKRGSSEDRPPPPCLHSDSVLSGSVAPGVESHPPCASVRAHKRFWRHVQSQNFALTSVVPRATVIFWAHYDAMYLRFLFQLSLSSFTRAIVSQPDRSFWCATCPSANSLSKSGRTHWMHDSMWSMAHTLCLHSCL